MSDVSSGAKACACTESVERVGKGVRSRFPGLALALAWALAFSMALSVSALAADGLSAGTTASTPQAAVSVTATATAAPKAPAVRDGIYQLRLASSPKRVVSVKASSLKAGANVVVATRKSLNSQRFAIRKVGGGYYRIGSPLSNMALSVKGASKKAGANIRMEPYAGKSRQLWRIEQLGGKRVRFVNRASGLALSFASAKAGANVRQAALAKAGTAKEKLQGFKLVKATVTLGDRAVYSNLIGKATGGGLKIANKVRGYTVNKRKWKELQNALKACSFSVSFVMLDCSTGMTVSYSPDRVRFGASTIKGLYTSYLYESELETGRLSRGRINGLVQPTIVHSNNGTYLSLRGGYGTQGRFNSWLRKAGVGSLGTWPSYSPRTLAKAWVNMLAYSNSKGKHVSHWKRTFSHSDMSTIHGALGKFRTTYSKPGWMYGGAYGFILNDGGVVDDRHGRQYVLAITTSANPAGQKGKVERVVKALDAIHMDMPKSR